VFVYRLASFARRVLFLVRLCWPIHRVQVAAAQLVVDHQRRRTTLICHMPPIQSSLRFPTHSNRPLQSPCNQESLVSKASLTRTVVSAGFSDSRRDIVWHYVSIWTPGSPQQLIPALFSDFFWGYSHRILSRPHYDDEPS
jgi:hypothetical protein